MNRDDLEQVIYERTRRFVDLDVLDAILELIAAEREACAKACEEVLEQYRGTDMGKHAELVGDDCAAAIRARGQE